MRILLNEIFHGVQGEGPNTGRPSVFVRLGACNLKCTWCDSKFTWDPQVQDNTKTTVAEVVRHIKKFPCKHLVLTGGEPLLQQGAIKAILEALPGYTAEIETNGSVPCTITRLVEQINCSPKLKNSGNKPYPLKIKPDNKKAIFKFVVQNPEDLKDIRAYIRANKLPKERVYLMPEGVTRQAMLERGPWLIELCKQEGYHFSPRLHVMLYGDERKK